MKIGRNPTDIRIDNKRAIMKIIDKHPATFQELSDELKLSTTSINNICRELHKKKLIQLSSVNSANIGRPATLAQINPTCGYIITIEFTSATNFDYFIIKLLNLKKEILCYRLIDAVIGETDKLNNTILTTIEEILSLKSLSNQDILYIAVAIPGMVNTYTGEVVATSLQAGLTGYNIKEFLEKTFNTSVLVQSLLYCAMKGEQIFGVLREHRDACMFLHISDSIGVTFSIDAKPFGGTHGYAGELGLINDKLTEGHFASLKDRRNTSINDALSLKSLKNAVKKSIGRKNTSLQINSDYLAENFLHGEEPICSFVKEHAKKLACFIENISILLDIKTVVLAGNVRKFGDKYLKIVNSQISVLHEFETKVFYSYSNINQSISDGLADYAVSATIEKCIK